MLARAIEGVLTGSGAAAWCVLLYLAIKKKTAKGRNQ